MIHLGQLQLQSIGFDTPWDIGGGVSCAGGSWLQDCTATLPPSTVQCEQLVVRTFRQRVYFFLGVQPLHSGAVELVLRSCNSGSGGVHVVFVENPCVKCLGSPPTDVQQRKIRHIPGTYTAVGLGAECPLVGNVVFTVYRLLAPVYPGSPPSTPHARHSANHGGRR